MFASVFGGGGGMSTSEVEKESRNITVSCQFQIKDAGTNEIIASHNGRPAQYHNKAKRPGFFFGSSKTEADMEPRDRIIGALIEKQLKQFMCKFVPTDIETSCEIRPSSHEMSIAGVEMLVAATDTSDFEIALGNFKQAIAEKATDHRSLFGAGVSCEKLKKFPEALKFYTRARPYEKDEQKYADAVERVSRMAGA